MELLSKENVRGTYLSLVPFYREQRGREGGRRYDRIRSRHIEWSTLPPPFHLPLPPAEQNNAGAPSYTVTEEVKYNFALIKRLIGKTQHTPLNNQGTFEKSSLACIVIETT